MSTFPAELIARYGIITAGGDLPEVRHYVPETNSKVTLAKDFVNDWVNERVDPELRRGPIVHVFAVTHSPAIVLADTAGGWLDYGHFSVLGTDEGFKACWEAYKKTVKGYECLSKVKFASYFKPRPFANATLVVTSDNKMLFVRRAANMHLHPAYLHCNGGKVAVPEPGQVVDLERGALKRLKIETNIPSGDIDEVMYLGLCRNDPFDEVIALFVARTALAKNKINNVYVKAQDPDGGVEWYCFDIVNMRGLLRGNDTTPSLKALLCLFLRQLSEESPPGK